MNKIIYLIIGLFISGCAREGIKQWDVPSSSSDLTMEGFTLVETDMGKKTLIIDAKRARINQQKKSVYAYDIKLQYFGKEEDLLSTLTAKEGFISMDTYNMEAKGDVLVITDDGARLETSKLTRDTKTGTITSGEDTFVKVTKGDNVLEGYGLESDSKLENVKIKKVKTTLTNMDQLKDDSKDENKRKN